MKFFYLNSLLLMFLAFSCKETSQIKNVKASIKDVDTIVSNSNNIVLNYSYCDLVNSEKFNLLEKEQINIPNIDSLTYGYKINSNKILLTYQFSKTDGIKLDRSLIFNGKKAKIKRIIIKDSSSFKFDGFMCDYNNGRFYSNKNNDILLIKSQPAEWTGLINQFEFYQLYDVKKNICYEFFLNEDKGCKIDNPRN